MNQNEHLFKMLCSQLMHATKQDEENEEKKKKEGSKQREGEESEVPNELFKKVCLTQPTLHESKADVEAIKELVASEAFQKKEALDAKNSKGETALFCAVARRRFHAARVLVEAGADACEPEDRSPLELVFVGTKGPLGGEAASFAGWLCETLSRQGKGDAMKRIFNNGRIGVFVCGRKKTNDEALRILLQYGMDANLCTYNMTLLQRAVVRGHVMIVQMLLDAGADVNLTNKDGICALHLAAMQGDDNMAMMLLRHGASDSIRCNQMDEVPEVAYSTPSQAAYIHHHAPTGMLIKEWPLWHGRMSGSQT